MAFPTDDVIAERLLELLAVKGGSARVSDIADELAKTLNLTTSDLNQRIRHSSRESGESAWKQRLRRVRHYLVKSGQLEPRGTRGVWVLAKTQ